MNLMSHSETRNYENYQLTYFRRIIDGGTNSNKRETH